MENLPSGSAICRAGLRTTGWDGRDQGCRPTTSRPVADIRGDELGGEDVSTRDRRARGQAALAAVMKQGPVKHSQLGTVQFSGSGVGRTLRNLDPAKLALIPHWREIIGAGELVASVPSYKPDQNVKAYHGLVAPVRIGGIDRDVRVVIREDNSGRFYYNFGSARLRPYVATYRLAMETGRLRNPPQRSL